MKEMWQRIWKNVKKGENIDIYLLVLFSVVVSVLALFGWVNEQKLIPLVLANLAFLSVAILGNRHILEQIITLTTKKEELFLLDYPQNIHDEMEKRFSDADDLFIFGTSLTRTLQLHEQQLERRLHSGKNVRVLLRDPNGKTLLNTLSKRRHQQTMEYVQNQINISITALRGLGTDAAGKADIRLIDSVIPRGGIIYDLDKADSLFILWDAGYKSARTIKYVIRSADGHAYNFFKEEVKAIWRDGIPIGE